MTINDLTPGGPEEPGFLGIDYLVPIGGDDTLSYGVHLAKKGVKVIAIPKTMDNDVPGTDYCIGFSTCITRTIEMTHNLRTTAGSHERILVIEVFGRYAGFTALLPTMAGAANRCVIPEYQLQDRTADRASGPGPVHQPEPLFGRPGLRGGHVRGRRDGLRERGAGSRTATRNSAASGIGFPTRSKRPPPGSTTGRRSTSSTSGWATWSGAGTRMPSTRSSRWPSGTWP